MTAVVLAAGEGKRMRSSLPKVLHEICGRPMVAYVVRAAREAGAQRILVVVGEGDDSVQAALADEAGLDFVTQSEQRGTGHAVETCRSRLKGHDGLVLILAGDAPLVRAESLGRLVEAARTEQAACVFGTAIVEDPSGLGRVIRDENGEFQAIVEEQDATEAQREVCEINPSYYVFNCSDLLFALGQLRPANEQNEFYLTDCPGALRAAGRKVVALNVIAPEEAYGVNSRSELAKVNAVLQQRIQRQWMDEGVTIVDPCSTFIDARATVGPDTVIFPFCYIEGPVSIGAGCQVGPFAHVRAGALLEPGAQVGPFAEVTARPPSPKTPPQARS